MTIIVHDIYSVEESYESEKYVNNLYGECLDATTIGNVINAERCYIVGKDKGIIHIDYIDICEQ